MNNHKNDIFDSEKTLDTLEEIGRNPQITQRALAEKLEISLGKINFLINALVTKRLNLTHKFFVWKQQEYGRYKKIEILRQK